MAFVVVLNASFVYDASLPREAVVHNLNACSANISSALLRHGFVRHDDEPAHGQPQRIRRRDTEVMVVDPHYRSFAMCRGLEPVALAYISQKAEEADELSPAQLALRAAAYCLHDQTKPQPVWWPGSADQWKPGSQVDNLARAAAILLRAIDKIGEEGNDRVPHVRHISLPMPTATFPVRPGDQHEDFDAAERRAVRPAIFDPARPLNVDDAYRITAFNRELPAPAPVSERSPPVRDPVSDYGSIPRIQSTPPITSRNWIYDAMRDRIVDRPTEESRQEPRENEDDAE